MSASEKLKALGEDLREHGYAKGRGPLTASLPQIVAVVEAAEAGRPNWRFTARLAAALTALEEALG